MMEDYSRQVCIERMSGIILKANNYAKNNPENEKFLQVLKTLSRVYEDICTMPEDRWDGRIVWLQCNGMEAVLKKLKKGE